MDLRLDCSEEKSGQSKGHEFYQFSLSNNRVSDGTIEMSIALISSPYASPDIALRRFSSSKDA
jgi:hypothetical protein